MVSNSLVCITLLLLLPGLTQAGTNGSFISMAPAGYPRALLLANGTRVATCEKADPSTGAPRIVLLAALGDVSEPWNTTATVVEDSSGVNPDLANGFPLELPGGQLLVAYRHHTGPASARVYRIALSASSDGGSSWSALAVIWAGPIGVWEPFLYVPPGAAAGVVRVAYSAELTNGGEQDIVQQESSDGGLTWGPRKLIVHTPRSRNGMPGIVLLPDASLLAVFEGFWTGVWGAFTVNAVRSFDGGVTWTQGEIVYAPPRGSGFNAGSPQVAVCPGSGAVRVVFMTSVPQTFPRLGPPQAWPDGASLALSSSALSHTNSSAPLNFSGAPAYVPLMTPSAYWPSFLYAGGGLAVVYQDTVGDAVQSMDAYCNGK